MKKTIIIFLVFLSILALLLRFGSQAVATILTNKEQAGIKVLSLPSEATVFINDEEVGKTPYESTDLSVGEYNVKVQADKAVWQGSIRLIGGTLTVINRELSPDNTAVAGEVLMLEKGRGVTIISYPGDAEVEIDGKAYSKTPVTVEIEPGDHLFGISKVGYLKRSIRAYAPEQYNLTINTDLALSEADLSAIVTAPITETQKVRVIDTPTKFLRVRDKPSTTGKEITKVFPGDELVLLEELAGWDRIRTPAGTEGYVSKSYVEKVTRTQDPK